MICSWADEPPAPELPHQTHPEDYKFLSKQLCYVDGKPLEKRTFAIGQGSFLLDGKAITLICGEMHPQRIPAEYWPQRLKMARAMGLNSVAIYVFWNAIEERPGHFDFMGRNDIAQFVRLAEKEGLLVLLRPGPYVCAEWDFGGFPAWLLKDHKVKVRSQDPKFLAACEGYFKALGRELVPLQIDHGGPIILMQVENEYGSYGSDKVYMGKIRDMERAAGFTLPLYTADGSSQMPNGYLPDVLPAVNGETGPGVMKTIDKFHPGGPYMVAEFYPGWLDHWGEPHAVVGAEGNAKALDWMLAHNVSVSLYMFHGGTNFGYMNGANFGGHFQPQPTSYDYAAPLDEAGRPNEKFYKFREAILKNLPKGTKLPEVPPTTPIITIPAMELTWVAGLFNELPKPIHSPNVLSMEDVDQAYGYILYRTHVKGPQHGKLLLDQLRDYAWIYINGRKVAELDRRDGQSRTQIDVPKGDAVLDILVENGGRINYGGELVNNRKGITERVSLAGIDLKDWEIFPLPLASVSSETLSEAVNHCSYIAEITPRFYRAEFELKEYGDTFLDMRGWGKGCVWVNGHNLGRFWYIGPQQTLYLPGVWLKKGHNDIVVLETRDHAEHKIAGLAEPILDKLNPDLLASKGGAVPAPKRKKTKPKLAQSAIVAEGKFAAGDDPQMIHFKTGSAKAISARYVALESLSSQAGDPWASVAELALFDAAGKRLSNEGWKVAYVDSEELSAEDGRAENAFDDDPSTIWHTQWAGGSPPQPHVLVLDLGKVESVAALRYQPRAGDKPGKIKEYRVYASKEAM